MKTYLITGASKGIGYHTVLNLANNGARVFAVSRTEGMLGQLEAPDIKNSINIITEDLTSASGIKNITKELNKIDTLDGLVNNAGALLNKPFMDTSIEEWKEQFEVNFFSVVNLIRSLKPKLQKGSHIVNISSMGGFQGSQKFPGLSAYSAAKGALAVLTESLSTEFSAEGISVNCLCLGAVQTQMLEQAFPGYRAPVQPEEMGEFIADFVRNAHRYMNGKVIPVALNNPD